MMIVGGWDEASKQVEVISPTTGKIEDCDIKPLPKARHYHTINKGTVCGGGEWGSSTRRSCIKMQSDGSWSQSHTLQERRLSLSLITPHSIVILSRWGHSSFSTHYGIVILGGADSPSTAELARTDGTTSVLRNYLEYPTQ